MIPLLNSALSVASGDGRISRDFHRWLDLVRRALHGPFVGQQATGSVVIRDGEGAVQVKRLLLQSNERLTIEGSGRLVICG
jgi:hypothetical protein